VQLAASPSDLTRLVAKQISNFFPDRDVAPSEIEPHLPGTLDRLEFCFNRTRNEQYGNGTNARFDPLHTDQYAIFLYFLANTVHRANGNPAIATKLYALNKALHALDIFYAVSMPDVWGVQHPVGTVVGRATLSNYLFLYQRCTIGGNLDLEYPMLGEGVVLFGDTAIVGRSTIGANTWISIGSKVVNTDIRGDQVVFGQSPGLVTKAAKRRVVDHFFRVPT